MMLLTNETETAGLTALAELGMWLNVSTQAVTALEQPRRHPLDPKFRAQQWRPGQSGNPGGKGGEYHEAIGIARKASPRAMQRLVELLESDDERVATIAADKLLERAWGKPKEYDPKLEQQQSQAFDPSAYTPAELALIRKLLLKGIAGGTQDVVSEGVVTVEAVETPAENNDT